MVVSSSCAPPSGKTRLVFPSGREMRALRAPKKEYIHIELPQCGCIHFSTAIGRVEKKVLKKF
jgi:hypothetical protein